MVSSSERPDGSERDERERVRRLEGILPELVKRVFEAGYERLSEGPENVLHFVSELKTEVRFIPNDAARGSRPVPDVKAKVSVKRDRTSRPPDPPADTHDRASLAPDPLANGQPNEESQS
jgi:hypothetical protein